MRGFTFIEAIAVATILAILSAIAIPTYLSYIKNQRRAGALAIAQTASSVAHLYWRKKGFDPPTDSVAAQVFLPGGDYTIEVQPPNVIVTQGAGEDTVKATVAFRTGGS